MRNPVNQTATPAPAGVALCMSCLRWRYGFEIDAPPKRCFQSGSTSLL
jgi:hypothetical protein